MVYLAYLSLGASSNLPTFLSFYLSAFYCSIPAYYISNPLLSYVLFTREYSTLDMGFMLFITTSIEFSDLKLDASRRTQLSHAALHEL